jgi:mRNA interferase RelE/StbE
LTYQIEVTPQARKMLRNISDRRVQSKIQERIDDLAQEPAKQGKALTEELTTYRSLRAVGQRYRIIYRVEEERVVVFVLAVGLRKEKSRRDIYHLRRSFCDSASLKSQERKSETRTGSLRAFTHRQQSRQQHVR